MSFRGRTIRSSFRRKQVANSEARVVIMDNTCVEEKFEGEKALMGVEVLRRVGKRLEIPDVDLKYFGLKYPDSDGQMNWLVLSEPVKKHVSKKPYQLQLAVRIYPEANESVSESCLKLCCYQVKSDINRGLFMCTPSQHASIDSYFAQAVIGDYKPKTHTPGYLEDFLGSLFEHPNGVNCSAGNVNPRAYEDDVVKRHEGHYGMTRKESWLALLSVASTITRFNTLKHQAKDCSDKTKVEISVSQEGVQVFNLNSVEEPNYLKKHFSFRGLAVICYKNKLMLTATAGKCKFKFTGLYGEKAARRVLEDILEARLYNNCVLTRTDPVAYHSEEARRVNESILNRRASIYRSFRNEPIARRQGSASRVYSSIRSRFSKKNTKRYNSESSDEVDDQQLRYKQRLSRIEMLPSEPATDM
ncbi:band 4.1-like protein 1 [Dendronephthya gigantea]|uniref:band 4.1-like protein 1 n=1 Tax=Dendronephthya gigantea TaxID=151771 RepID=UPI001068F1AD|nr:band 4.1-like protein 1 [Dendronephthya gigantea]